MTDVFISYKREERGVADKIAQALIAHGLSVWWDADMLPGEEYRRRTLEVLRTCKAAIVVWSKQSVGSGWVLDEAQRAKDRGVLVPVMIEALEDFPLGFGQLHTHTLIGWGGAADDALFKPVLAAVERLAGRPATAAAQAEPGDMELRFWRGIQDSRNPSDFELCVARFPHGVFTDLARQRLAALQKPASSIPLPNFKSLFGVKLAHQTHSSAGLGKWELGFILLVVLIAPFLLWPIANAMNGYSGATGVFYGRDFSNLFSPDFRTNLYLMTPLLMIGAWAYDRLEAFAVAKASASFSQAKLALRGLIGFILLILVVTGIRNGDDGVQTHAALWTACAWGATLAARKITPRLKRAFLD